VDLLALGLILLMPALAHTTGIPFYFLEPMRMMLIVALIFSNRYNAYAIAVLLPIFSFLISGHPALVKMSIIIAELLLNVWLFLKISGKTKKPFISMFSAILLSKLFCYLMYWIVFSQAFVIEESQPVFLISQLAIALVLSYFIAIISAKRPLESMKK
jgi:hypothetical protein